MPRFLITAPDGTKYQLDGPDGSTADDALKIVQAQHPAPPNPVAQMPAMDPSAGGSTLNIAGLDTGIKTPEWLDRGLAGAGQAVVNTARGIGQAVGAVSRQDVADARKLDAPLDATAAGKVGNVLGNIGIMTVPTLLTGGAAAGVAAPSFLARSGVAAGTGAGVGFLQPSVSTGDTLKNTALGAVAGGVTPAIGQGIQAVAQGGKALVEPFLQGGVDRITGRTLNAFAGSSQAAQDAATALKNATPAVPGVQPTMGMVANNGGLQQLQRTIANNPDLTTAFTTRNQGNTNALLDALQSIAGSPGQRDFFAADRSAAANDLYGQAFSNYTGDLTPALKGQVTQLLKRPSIDDGSRAAQALALERGQSPSAAGSLQSLHDVKSVLDDKISEAVQAGRGTEASALQGTQNKLLNLMDQLSPDYKAARATYAEMSKPINRMDVGQSLLDTLSPALNEFSANKVLQPNAFTKALAAGDATAQKATGFSGAKMDQVLTPEDMQSLQGVGTTLGQIRDAQIGGKAIGSNTAQNLVSQNVLRQIAGPLGLPEGFVENQLMGTLMRPVQFAGQMAQPKITARLGRAALDPKDAGGLMLNALQQTDDPRLRNLLARALLAGSRAETARFGQE